LLIESFNGKPQASLPYFAYACGSPLNESTQYATESTLGHHHAAHSVHVIAHNFSSPSRDTFDVNGNNPEYHHSGSEPDTLLTETPTLNSLCSPSDDGNHERKIAC
jgi:hypothetical protein